MDPMTIPSEPVVLPDDAPPKDAYGRFVFGPTEMGHSYGVPHTLGGSVLAVMTSRHALAWVAAAATLLALVRPVSTPGSPLSRYWLHVLLLFLLLHLFAACVVGAVMLVTGVRKITHIEIREDGLVVDRHFFPANHIWSIGYGTTINEGKADEEFVPCFRITFGTRDIVLADRLDVPSAKLFKQLFEDDVRRYWHRHN